MSNKPEVAELAKTLVNFNYHGVISTIATDGGYPYGSVIDYLPLSGGDVVVLLNENAEHYRYLKANPRASLLINAHLAEHEALYTPRLTLLGEAKPMQDPSGLAEEYLKRHPDAREYIEQKGLSFFQLDVQGVRFIPGNGRAIWLDAVDYRAAKPDPLGEVAPWLIHELIDRHHTELVKIARNVLDQDYTDFCRVVSLDRLGMDVVCYGEEKQHAVRMAFDEPVANSEELHVQLKRLYARAVLRNEPDVSA